MAVTLNTSYLSLLLANTYNTALDTFAQSAYRLSTGNRINTAADDPAGIALAESYRAKMATYNQAQSNAQEAVSLIQTAEGAMDVIDEKLTRMKELAEQASTGTYTDAQRLVMHSEFELMAAEIDRIAASTSYNGTKLLDGTLASSGSYTTSGGWTEPQSSMLITIGDGSSRAEDYYYITIPDTRTSALFTTTNIAVSTQTAAQAALTEVDSAITVKDNARAWLGALENRLEGTIDVLESSYFVLEDALENIEGVDYAEETSTLLSSMMTAQASIAMIAQANVLPQLALNLIEAI